MKTKFAVRSNTATAKVSVERAFTHDDIAAKARALWDKQGRPEGRDDEFWFQAERELRTPAQIADDRRFADPDALLDKDGDPNDAIDQRLDALTKPRADRSATSL